MVNRVIFQVGETTKRYHGLWQWDYGQILEIHGIDLPPAVEVHFAMNNSRPNDATVRIGTTVDKVTTVAIPERYLEQCGDMVAYIYISDAKSGKTEYQILCPIKARQRPEAFERPKDAELFREAIEAVRQSAALAQSAGKSAEAWAHGREEYPERAEDNARYYAEKAKDILKEVPGEVQNAKTEIDRYIQEKETELKGETGNVYFAVFRVVNGRLKMYSDPNTDKVRFVRKGSRLKYRMVM